MSTNTIAAHLAISPGNLYYHFANKEQIIRELFSQIGDEGLLITRGPKDGSLLTPEELSGFFIAAIDMVWRYRFFFRHVHELVARDAELSSTFRSTTKLGWNQLRTMLESLIQNHAMSAPTSEGDFDRLCTNIHLVLTNWIQLITTTWGIEAPSQEDIAEGGLQAFLVLEPYLVPHYAEAARAILDRRLPARNRLQLQVENRAVSVVVMPNHRRTEL